MIYRIRNWKKFQHFKDRSPPWVKVYRDILDDPDWHDLDGDSAKVLTMLWLIASEDETHTGTLPDSRKLAFRLRMKESHLNQILTKLFHWLEQADIDLISEQYPLDAPETETETEVETEKETDISLSESKIPTCPQEKILILWNKHLPHLTQPRSWEGARQQSLKQRWIQASKPSSYSDGYKSLDDGLGWWNDFFQYIATGTKLAQGFESQGRVWTPTLEWILKLENFQKIIDGKYNK